MVIIMTKRMKKSCSLNCKCTINLISKLGLSNKLVQPKLFQEYSLFVRLLIFLLSDSILYYFKDILLLLVVVKKGINFFFNFWINLIKKKLEKCGWSVEFHTNRPSLVTKKQFFSWVLGYSIYVRYIYIYILDLL